MWRSALSGAIVVPASAVFRCSSPSAHSPRSPEYSRQTAGSPLGSKAIAPVAPPGSYHGCQPAIAGSLGTSVVLAQSIFTVFAEAYAAPWMTVRTSISLTDELLEGKSLSQKEAETVVSTVGEARRPGVLRCLFDELFRGTNSVDRISAIAAVVACANELAAAMR